ncbi:MAG TPA: M43 family zinc metalloprotease, partial [Chitinophagales bacterium]|nr:M43 family zinc metalloprotease [Chitinophagales bacterium]
MFLLLISPSLSHAQSSCGTDEIHEFQMKTDSEYRRLHLQQNDAIRTIIQNKENARGAADETVYTIPVVVHVVHLGEDVGTGSNISDHQIREAIRGLNERYRNIRGDGEDIRLEFCLATQDPNGLPTNGINRVDGSGVKNYEQYGIGGSCDGTSASETAIKNLSRWPVLKYYNIWVVHKICGGWAGYAYYPNGFAFDGAVMLRHYMTYSSSTLAHELGHGFNLAHTFNGDDGNRFCPPNKNCATQGDYVCDTPPHKQNECGISSTCSTEGDWDNSRFNYMSYCSKKTRFTQGQKDRIRATLSVYPRANLLKSSGCKSIINNSIVLKDISNLSGTICHSNQLKPVIKVENTGANVIDSIRIAYTLNGKNEKIIAWTGTISQNEEVSIQLPKLEEVIGENVLDV